MPANIRPTLLVLAAVGCGPVRQVPRDAPPMAIDVSVDAADVSGIDGRAPDAEDTSTPRTLFRPVFPGTAMRVTNDRPTLRWAREGFDGAHVQLCVDRACGHLITEFDAEGDEARPPTPLPPGPVYWRIQPRRGDTTIAFATPTWWFRVPLHSRATDTAWGAVFDADGDARTDHWLGLTPPDVSAHYETYYYGRWPASDALRVLTPWGGAAVNVGDVTGDGFGDVVKTDIDVSVTAPVCFDLHRGGPRGIEPYVVTRTCGYPDDEIVSRTASLGPSNAGGDIDGDGYADVVATSARYWAATQTWEGRNFFVYRGAPTGLPELPSQEVNADSLTVMAQHTFGQWFAEAGDLDGDRYADFAATVVDESGLSLIALHGGPSGLTMRAPVRVAGSSPFAMYFLGDIDGDGYADVGVGAVASDGTRRVFIAQGSASGVRETRASVSLRASDAVVSVGDANGDGFDDVALFSLRRDPEGESLRLYGGSPSGLSSEPLSTSVFPDAATGVSRRRGWHADVNGDGLSDLLLFSDETPSSPPVLYIYEGRPEGFAATPDASETFEQQRSLPSIMIGCQ